MPRTPMALGGGGIVTIVILLAIFLLGGNPLGDGSGPFGDLAGQSVGTQAPGKVLTECQTGADANEREDCRILAVINSVLVEDAPQLRPRDDAVLRRGHPDRLWAGLVRSRPVLLGGQVRLELQADCFAGLWVGHALDTGFVEDITRTDIADALDAAAAVGDDRIQERAQGRVTPETFTHGTSEQRQSWFVRGIEGTGPQSCDTFSGNV